MKKLICATFLLPTAFALADGGTEIHVKPTVVVAPVKVVSTEAPRFYGRIDAGVSVRHKFADSEHKLKTRNAFVFGAGVGYKHNENFRTDLNIQHRTVRAKGGHKLHGTNGFFNIYADIPTDSALTPYVTGGLGYSHNKLKISNHATITTGKSKGSFAWNVGAGTLIKFNRDVSFDAAYRYVDLGKFKYAAKTAGGKRGSSTLRAHEVTAGVIFKF